MAPRSFLLAAALVLLDGPPRTASLVGAGAAPARRREPSTRRVPRRGPSRFPRDQGPRPFDSGARGGGGRRAPSSRTTHVPSETPRGIRRHGSCRLPSAYDHASAPDSRAFSCARRRAFSSFRRSSFFSEDGRSRESAAGSPGRSGSASPVWARVARPSSCSIPAPTGEGELSTARASCRTHSRSRRFSSCPSPRLSRAPVCAFSQRPSRSRSSPRESERWCIPKEERRALLLRPTCRASRSRRGLVPAPLPHPHRSACRPAMNAWPGYSPAHLGGRMKKTVPLSPYTGD